jgi:hypothetical protein
MLLRSVIFVVSVFTLVEQVCAAQVGTLTDAPRSDYFESIEPAIGKADFNQANRERPAPVGLSSEWITDAESGLATAQANVTIPLLFISTPPPLVKVGFAYTDLFAADDFGLPNDLYEYTIGLSWIRKINDQWTVRTTMGIGFATDGLNTSRDAWQFRGGVFGIYKRNERLSWTFGALATGRDDLPVIPAVGAVWMPNPNLRYDLTFPKPRVNFLIRKNGPRQHWAYLGGGINGNTWGYQQSAVLDDRLTYKDVRVVAGWESRPTSSSTTPFARGRTFQAEIGYVFARTFEFEDESRSEALDDSLMVSISAKF